MRLHSSQSAAGSDIPIIDWVPRCENARKACPAWLEHDRRLYYSIPELARRRRCNRTEAYRWARRRPQQCLLYRSHTFALHLYCSLGDLC